MINELLKRIRLKTLLMGLVLIFLAIGSTSVSAQADSPMGYVVDPYHAYSYGNMLEDASELAALYPDLIKISSIGKSVEERDLLLIELGSGDRKIFLCGTTHAREYISTTYLMYMIDRYAYAYSSGGNFEGYDIAKLLDSVTFCIVPMVNPDGVNLVQNGISSVLNYEAISKMVINKADHYGYTSWKANISGIDLNKNFPFNWYDISSVNAPSSSGFKGYSPLSAPESKALYDYLNANMCWSYMTFHSQGEGLYGWNDQNAGYYPQLYDMISRIIKSSGFRKFTDTSSMNYGSFAEYARRTYLKPSLTIELCEVVGSYPFPNEKFDSVWAPAKIISLIVAEEVLKMKSQDYHVYQNTKFLHGFSDEKFALTYAKKWAGSKVLFVNSLVNTFGSIVPADILVLINGSDISFQAYTVDGSNYIKLRDLAAALLGTDQQFEVGYDSVNKAIALTSKTPYTSIISEPQALIDPVSLKVMPSNQVVFLDGSIIDIKAYNIGGNNYFNIDDMVSALNF